ncbi:hypothetical protein CHCC15292_3813 [Bacillus licheniformis]|nr:hypothetical protein CHCC15292_3813 [Bacillus licheniformis]
MFSYGFILSNWIKKVNKKAEYLAENIKRRCFLWLWNWILESRLRLG